MSENETEILPLASEFPAATRDAWRKLAESALKGRPFDTLQTRTADGFALEPLYERAANALPLPGRASAGVWQVMARVELPEPAAANAEALHELESGAGGLTLVLAGSVSDFGFGLGRSADALGRVLEGVYLEAGVAIELDGGDVAVARDLAAVTRQRGVAPEAANIRFGLDPLGTLAVQGAMAQRWEEAGPAFASGIRELAAAGFRGPFAAADGRAVHAAGGSEAQELAFALAAALSYLRALEAHGVPLEDARRALSFRLAADADQWLTAAKFRALRKLWARVEEVCGLSPAPAFVSAETAWRMVTRRDPYVNMLRATVAAFAAALGGVDAIAVLPFTAALGLPDRFARRMARNTQLILQEESHLAAVTDAGFGSGALDDATAQLCGTAWRLLQDIEAAGGLAVALESGLIQNKVAAAREARARAIATRKSAITGVSDFPNLQEAPVPVLQAAPTAARSPLFPRPAIQVEPLRPTRVSEPFEALRDVSDRVFMDTGVRPKIFLATLGKAADHTARAAFAKNLFEAGGIEAVPLELGSDLAESFRASRAALACLCSSDAVYAAEAPAAARALAAAGARQIFLAGRPSEHEAAWRDAGVERFIYAGCDALAVLRAAYDILRETAEAVPDAEP